MKINEAAVMEVVVRDGVTMGITTFSETMKDKQPDTDDVINYVTRCVLLHIGQIMEFTDIEIQTKKEDNGQSTDKLQKPGV